MAESILVVEDDDTIRDFIKEMLLDNGYAAHSVSDGLQALDFFKKTVPDLVIMDLGLPSMTGSAVTTEIRKKHKDVPIIILTAKDSINDILSNFEIGADDYITKPFNADELLARVKARLKKTDGSSGAMLKIADLELDDRTLEVKRANKNIQLTPQEFKLLKYLMSNKGRILTREMILSRIWLYSTDVETRVVDVYIGYLRKKIDSGFDKKLIHSARGFGYVIKE